ncbi:MAG: Zn-ribbon domain-containing OB-fold protein [Acidimicrobiia bacterium]
MVVGAARPIPSDKTRFYWDGAREGRLLVLRCAACGRWQHPPDVGCPGCLGDDLVPTEMSGRGAIYSYSVVRQAFDPAFVSQLPFVVALVELEEAPSVRMLTNIVDADPADVRVGMAVEVVFEDHGDWALPQFRPC